jgi:signal transduction histidine kinase
MKKTIYTFLLLFSLSLVLTNCREENKTPEQKIEEALEEVSDDMEEASDDVKDALEDVQDEIEEVEEESK